MRLALGTLFFLLSLSLTAQKMPTKDYDSWWKQIDGLINEKGQLQTALKEVDQLYQHAIGADKPGQELKALVYKIQLNELLKENSTVDAVALLRQQAATAQGLRRSLTHVLLADYYKKVYDRLRWRMYDRTAQTTDSSADITTWSPAIFHDAITKAYMEALASPALKKEGARSFYEPLVIKGGEKNTRPSLYELVLRKALQYFKEDPVEIAKPAEQSFWNTEAIWQPVPGFLTFRLSNTDSTNGELITLKLYQELSKYFLDNKNQAALAENELDRFGYLKSKEPASDSLYVAGLKTVRTSYAGTPAADRAGYLLAEWYKDENEDLVQAMKLLEEVVSKGTTTPGAKMAYNLMQELKSSNLYLQTERVNLPDQPFQARLEWKNLQKVYLKIVAFDKAKHQKFLQNPNYFDSSNWQLLAKAPALKSWEQALPLIKDYKSHSAEIKIDGLPIGSYYLLVSDQPGFGQGDANLGVIMVQVSNISYIRNNRDYFVLHRNTGQPLSNAGVQVFQRSYDYQTRTYARKKIDDRVVNANGYMHLGAINEKNSGNISIDVQHGKDYLRIDDQDYIYVNNTSRQKLSVEEFEKRNGRVYYFTDRSIYRPGQTIYFKGIVTTKDQVSQLPKIQADKKTTIVLYNANGEKADSVSVTSNEFGSFAGKFTLPASGLTGSFRIQDDLYGSSSYFSVEEYKRPRFEVTLNNINGSVRLGDSVQISGKATAYAGNAISNANGTFRVVRQVRYLYPWRRIYGGYKPQPKSAEIAHGTIQTAADGTFEIVFKAIPDGSVDRATDPVFDYQVSIDVTDLNGETRSAANTVQVSYKSLLLTVAPKSSSIVSSAFDSLILRAANQAGELQVADVNVKILPLQSPNRLIRDRYWPMPDTTVYTKAEFLQYFPLDPYRDDNNPETWPTGTAVFDKTVRTDSTGLIALGKNKWATGWYQLVATTKDKDGNRIESRSMVFLGDPVGKSVAAAGYLRGLQTRTELLAGQTAQIQLATEANELFIIEQRENWKLQENETALPFSEKFRVFKLGRAQISLPITASEADKGGIRVQHVTVLHNRVFLHDSYFTVPMDEKDLAIRLETFRDKLEPGLQQTWTVSVAGKEAEKFGMELLSSMYDASLDQFAPHAWSVPSLWPTLARQTGFTGHTNFTEQGSANTQPTVPSLDISFEESDRLIEFQRIAQQQLRIRGASSVAPSAMRNEARQEEGYLYALKIPKKEMVADSAAAPPPAEDGNEQAPTPPPAIRSNFNETAFFFPQLAADSNGHFSFSFTMPESVTTWKWQLLAHTKSLAMGYLQQSIITQKDLMVQPNMPRFLREGDQLEITTKVVNLTDKEITGQAELQLIDATTNQPVDGWFRNFFPNQYFTVAAKGSELVKFPVQVPYQFDRALTWKIIARAGDKTDGESAILPVLTNRQLVTEATPFIITDGTTKTISLPKLINSKDSETLSNQSLTVEFSSNPAWYAIQSLPYLTDFPYECAEQSFNRLYGSLIADHLLQSAPRIRAVLEQWQQKDTSALLSNLQKNEQLRQVLLEETPWVLEAKSEAEQKKRLLLLFDASKLKQESAKMIAKLKEMQSANGGFSWFKGGPDDRFITQYILTGIGHLQKLGIVNKDYGIFASIIPAALSYADQRMLEDYNKRDKKAKQINYLNYAAVQYHYMRSFYTGTGLSGGYLTAANHYRKEIQSNWIKGNLMAKAMITLALHRTGDKATAQKILKSLQESAINSEDKGMYWKTNTAGYFWQEAPIETQALLIEAFQEMGQPAQQISAMKTWLLVNKQTNRWSSTKATADACYALLLQGGNWLQSSPKVSVELGSVTRVTPVSEEAGTGYYQKIIPGTAVFPEMGNIKVNVQQPGNTTTTAPVWGAIYWQYFDNLENITASGAALKLSKQVMIERLTDNGPVLQPIEQGGFIKVGDKITVRLVINTDRDMEYVHVKDMRASALEPTNVLSDYRWQGSLGFYESTRDASTNFFIQFLPKGTHVLEYRLFVTHSGTFSNGISSAQCMYAPEFTSYTDGIQISVEAN